MTARKKGGASASQFVMTMEDGEDGDDSGNSSNIVGRLKATTRTSEEFQVPQIVPHNITVLGSSLLSLSLVRFCNPRHWWSHGISRRPFEHLAALAKC